MIRTTSTGVVLAVCLLLVVSAGAIAVAGMSDSPDSDDSENESTDDCRDVIDGSDDDLECEYDDNGSVVDVTISSGEDGEDGESVTVQSETVADETGNSTAVSQNNVSATQTGDDATSTQNVESNVSTSQDGENVSTQTNGVAEDGEDGQDGDVNIDIG